ncbi:hypothetical protein N2152v2_008262 [Parachlorella kessleri]
MQLAGELREEVESCLRQYEEAGLLALTAKEDEYLYGSNPGLCVSLEASVSCCWAGYLFGGLMLNKHIRSGAVQPSTLHRVAQAVLSSGRSMAGSLGPQAAPAYPTPLMYVWPPGPDASPYLGAAHGLMGRRQAREEPQRPDTHLCFRWHGKPYLGAAHGMMGILYVLLHFPGLLESDAEAAREVEGALHYTLSLECNELGVRGK